MPGLLQAFKDQDEWVRAVAAKALGEIGTLDILKQLIQASDTDFRDPIILSLARNLAIRYSKEKVDFIPVYPEVIERYRRKGSRPKS